MSPLKLAALATCALPGLEVVGLRPPQFSDEVVTVTGIVDSTGQQWIVVSPHDTVGGLDLESQTAVLSNLSRAYDAQVIPFDVPRPAGVFRTRTGTYVMVHPNLGGDILTDDDFEEERTLPVSLARSLAALHNLPAATYTIINLPLYNSSECRERHFAVLSEISKATTIPSNLAKRWDDALHDSPLWRFRSVPIHGDLDTTSFFVNHGSVTGMTGFASAHVGDPAQDIAWILAQSSDKFLEKFRTSYVSARNRMDLHLFTRAQLLSELAITRWYSHGLHANDTSICDDAINMLQDLSAAVGDEPLRIGGGLNIEEVLPGEEFVSPGTLPSPATTKNHDENSSNDSSEKSSFFNLHKDGITTAPFTPFSSN